MTTTFDAITAGLHALQEKLKAGDLVYIDSFTGLVPAKIVSIAAPTGNPWEDNYGTFITVKVTGSRPGYPFGKVVECTKTTILARRAVFTRDHQLRIRQLNYTYEPTKENSDG